MDNVRFAHFATQQVMTRRSCPTDNNNPCDADIDKSNCIECANRYFQKVADVEREERIDE